MVRNRGQLVVTAFAYLVVIIASTVALVPIVAGFITAFKPGPIQIASPPVWIFTPTLDNFRRILIEKENLHNLMNSVIVTTTAVGLSLLVGVPAAYALARFRMRGRRQLLSWIVSLRVIPPVVVAIPFFILFQTLGLYDSYFSLTLAYLTFGIPMVIWIMRGYFAEIPSDLEESAMVDGCSRLGALRRVLLPVMTPGLVATALLVVMIIWNEYLLALILTGGQVQTMPVAAARYITRTRVEWGELFAANMLIAVPVLLLAFALQKQLVRGLTFGMIE
jgi:multiple sugar transport system permease protein